MWAHVQAPQFFDEIGRIEAPVGAARDRRVRAIDLFGIASGRRFVLGSQDDPWQPADYRPGVLAQLVHGVFHTGGEPVFAVRAASSR
jgi:hypothetical protein